MTVADNIEKLEERIQKACDKARRKREDVTLMGVSKFIPIEKIKEAYNAGLRCFGESRVKEAYDKFGGFAGGYNDAKLHLIGSLQRNKAKSAALLFDCIQSVDMDELIQELSKHSPLRQEMRLKPLEVMLEFHTGEDSKGGYKDIDALLKAAELILNGGKLKPVGLMTMAPFTDDTELICSSFKRLVKAQKELEKRFPLNDRWAYLSMGMSNDFEIAIEQGSTLLRIGGAIFKDQ